MTLPAPKRMNQHASHRRAPVMEAETAAKLGGRTTKGSGNQTEKGDVRLERVVRVECKATANKSFSITREMWEKITNAAVMAGEIPAIHVEFDRGMDGPGVKRLYVIPEWAMEALVQQLQTP